MLLTLNPITFIDKNLFLHANQMQNKMKNYLVRLGRYLFILLILVFILIIVTNLGKQISYKDIFRSLLGTSRIRIFLIIAGAYALIYPFLVFGKKERYLNGSFEKNRTGLLKAFEEQNYVLAKESETKLEFRKKSGFSKFMLFGQDKIEVDISGNPIIIDGLRKELQRLNVSLDMNLLNRE